ncbi:MAG TPA: PEP-CTERM sorting domain-containing protein [Bryobacteraceae bacterium]|nr:PEP-CTERM sorting domain-containing protein [Bryobacteraceae bacterium]
MRGFLTACLLVVAGCGAINASIIFTPGNNPSNDVNILLNAGQSGVEVTGTPDGISGIIVDFTSTETLLEPSAGQARVADDPEGNPLTNLTIATNGFTYTDLIINPFIGGQCPTCTGGASTITVNALNSSGQPEAPVVFTGLNIGNGNNFLTIVATGGESIVSTTISDPGGFNDLQQPRISGPFAAVPEPATWALIPFGLMAGLVLRRMRCRIPRSE